MPKKAKKKPAIKKVEQPKKDVKMPVNEQVVETVETKKETPKKKRNLGEIVKTAIFRERLLYTLFGVIAMTAVILISFMWIPSVYDKTDTAAEERAKVKEQEDRDFIAKNKEAEDAAILGKSHVNLKTNFGDLRINLDDNIAPKAVDNFLRLTFRGKYDNTKFYEIDKQDDSSMIKGGDYDKNDGTGNTKSAELTYLIDEVWEVIPQFDDQGKLLPGYKFTSDKYYANFNEETGYVTFPKGTIAMLGGQGANTATSKFFITLKDTTLPANYTAFGSVDSSSFDILDSIYNQVNPAEGSTDGYGTPDKEIKIEKAEIL